MIDIACVKTSEEFFSLRKEWADLLSQSKAEDITLTWEWLYTWWETFKEKRQLWLLMARDDKEIIGIAPLCKRTINHYGVIPIKRIELLGTGEDEADEICSDYLDFIVKIGREKEVGNAIYNYMVKHSTEWDELYLADILDSSESAACLLGLFKNNRYQINLLTKTPCPYIDLPPTWETLIGASKNRRKHVANKNNLMTRQGTVEYSLLSNRDDSKDAFQTMIDLHQQRWSTKNERGCFSSDRFTMFHKKIFELLLPLERVRLYFLKLNGKHVACQYCFSYKNKYYDYLKGFDINLSKTVSPGFLLLAHAIKDSIARGNRAFDFFKGSKGSYKYWWTDRQRYVLTYRVARNNSFKNRIYNYLNSVKKSVKRIAGKENGDE